MLHRLREAITSQSIEKFKHKDKKLNLGRGSVGKHVVMGVLERGDHTNKSKVKAHVIPNTGRKTLMAKIRESIEEFATVYTDTWDGYNGLSASYLHTFVDHQVQYALGQVRTNGIENFWSLLKRCLKGTYIAVHPFHLRRHIDEMVYRFNHRGGTDRDRFVTAMGMIQGKRLTFDELTRSTRRIYDEVLPRLA